MKRILITGCSGSIGAALSRSLADHPLVKHVIGVDTRPCPLAQTHRFTYVPADVRDGVYLRSIIEEREIDAVVHLAYVTSEVSDHAFDHLVNVDGVLSTLNAAAAAPRVEKLVLPSSALAYGAYSDNPVPLKEDDPLRVRGLHYGVANRRMEEAVSEQLRGLRKDLQVSLLRLCTIVGDEPRKPGLVTAFRELTFGPHVALRDCPLQFLTLGELMPVFHRVLEAREFRGVYNVAPDGHTTLKTLCRRLKRWQAPVPYFFLWFGLYLCRKLRPDLGLSEDEARYLLHPVVMDNSKLKHALNLTFETGSEEAFVSACTRGRGAGNPE